MTSTDAHPNELIITRVFAAPRKLVWEAWTQPQHIEKWMGPAGFTTRVTAYDFRPGGKWQYIMIGPDKTEYPCHGMFREIVPLERYVSTDEFDDEYKNKPGLDLPQGMIVTTLFEDIGDKTRVTIRTMHPTLEDKQRHEKMGVIEGWRSTMDKLDVLLAEMTA